MRMLTLVLLTGALLGAGPARAASHFIVVPSPSKAAEAPADPVAVSLFGSLPAGTVGTPYVFDMTSLLSVTGDSALDLSQSTWVANNPLPTGLSLDSEGMLTGTPTTKNEAGTSFEVVASYKGQGGQQVYTLVVNGAVLQATQLTMGSYHTCALTPAGGVKCWGNNSVGQLGDGTGTTRLGPVDVVGLSSGMAHISAGQNHTCALSTTGVVRCWGSNDRGQLGDGTCVSWGAPKVVASDITQISAGGSHTCAIAVGGAAKCWGDNTYGQAGLGYIGGRSSTPTNVAGDALARLTQVSAGYSHTCGVTTTGAAVCWGFNGGVGSLGNNSTTDSPRPVAVVNMASGVESVATGYYHACGGASNGVVSCWGDNQYYQSGGSAAYYRTAQPVLGLSASSVVKLATGSGFTCALTSIGQVRCWGRNVNGNLGDGTTTSRSDQSPAIPIATGASSIATGWAAACALLSVGKMHCWGNNFYGQLGNGTMTNSSIPVDVLPR